LRRQEGATNCALAYGCPLVRALVAHREELAVNAQDPDRATLHADYTAAFVAHFVNGADPISHRTVLQY
jgi:hypothetical protein